MTENDIDRNGCYCDDKVVLETVLNPDVLLFDEYAESYENEIDRTYQMVKAIYDDIFDADDKDDLTEFFERDLLTEFDWAMDEGEYFYLPEITVALDGTATINATVDNEGYAHQYINQ